MHALHRILFITLLSAACDSAATPLGEAEALPATAADSGKLDDAARPARDAGKVDERDAAVEAEPTVAPGEQRVKLRFHARLGDQPFACGDLVEYRGRTIALRDLRLFVQDVALVDADGREVPVKLDTRDPWQNAEVALLDFENASGECFASEQTNEQITGVVPQGEYRALRFSHGVPEQLNHDDPKTFPAPLRTPGMSWNWLLGLRFVRFEVGEVRSDEDDAGTTAGILALHVGSTGCAGNQNEGTIQCKKPNRSRVELRDFQLGTSEIVLDVDPILQGSDLTQTIECHSGTNICAPMFKALGVDYETGQPSSDQKVFRLK